MRPFFIALLLVLTVGCNMPGKEQPGPAKQDSLVTRVPVPAVIKINPGKIIATAIPASLKYQGKLKEAWQWEDNLGTNILITSITEPYEDTKKNKYGDEGKTAELHVFHFCKKDSSYRLLWKISDGEKACPFDITCDFIKDATTVTDLDADGIAEITVQYRLACRSDVSPAYMKLIMYEDNVKYALQGNQWMQYSPDFKFTISENNVNLEKLPPVKDETKSLLRSFGRYETEKEFAGAPAVFLSYARKEWLKFIIERIE